ncbi:MAG: hydrogenase maturation nickel metallochaperone HypA [Hyphomicrobiaceae bacterium]
MHELSITRNIVTIVAEHAHGRPVRRVVLEIGALSGVMADSVAFCFDVVAKGTALEGAVLEIRSVPGRGKCKACGRELKLDTVLTACSCGSREVVRVAGEELKIKEYELEEAA